MINGGGIVVIGALKSSATLHLVERPASDRLEPPAADAPRDRIGEFHVMNPVSKSRVRYFAFTPDGGNKIFLNLPLAALLSSD